MTQQPLVPGAAPKTVLGADDVRRAITRIAHEIVERNRGLDGVVLVGLQRGGVWLAEQLGGEVARIERDVPVGAIDVALYRDDIALRDVIGDAIREGARECARGDERVDLRERHGAERIRARGRRCTSQAAQDHAGRAKTRPQETPSYNL